MEDLAGSDFQRQIHRFLLSLPERSPDYPWYPSSAHLVHSEEPGQPRNRGFDLLRNVGRDNDLLEQRTQQVEPADLTERDQRARIRNNRHSIRLLSATSARHSSSLRSKNGIP